MKFEHTSVMNLENALRGMRHPLESYDKSDSCYVLPFDGFERDFDCDWEHYKIGEADMKLAMKLRNAGSPAHRKFLRQIFVSVDITAPLYIWKEIDTYKVGTVANSTSTMHKLSTTPITFECFETDDLADEIPLVGAAACMIEDLEKCRIKYLETKDKRYWKELIRWLPESWLQTRTMTMSYENLVNMYHDRKDHKLTEWHTFCDWIKTLPYSELITGEE